MKDLHLHTNHSDGRISVKDLLTRAENAKLKTISITDHNNVGAYKELANPDVRSLFSGKIIPGIELEFGYNGVKSELLGYDFDLQKMESVDFLQRDVRTAFMVTYPYIKTKPKDEPPAKFNNMATVTNSLIGSGAIINGQSSGSVIFRNVFTGEHSSVSHAIIMEGSYIGNNCVVQNAILDKEVTLQAGARVIGTPDSPVVITKSAEVRA